MFFNMMEYHMEDYLPIDSIYMVELSKRMSRTPMKNGFPDTLLREELNKI